MELSRSAEFQVLAVARAEAARVPSPPSSRAVATRVTQALERLAGPVPTQELLPAPTRHIRYMVTALMGMFAVSLLLTMIQLNIESYNAPLPGPELAQPSAPTAAESLIADTTRSKPRAPDHWAELQSNWRRKGVLTRISELFKEAGAKETYEDLVDRSYILINGVNPSETAFLETSLV
ncbi:hypothetical protein A4X09_0g6620 [Tilletia walkeri]|uniref:Uncharacterized protein n=1 Tax=Tilletia walkeri TaxID=117179 RepID=A0A8X7N3F5_9BASI|nr:hypothetical protein A4X09_0g6620 [Tilletia walkeri]